MCVYSCIIQSSLCYIYQKYNIILIKTIEIKLIVKSIYIYNMIKVQVIN